MAQLWQTPHCSSTLLPIESTVSWIVDDNNNLLGTLFSSYLSGNETVSGRWFFFCHQFAWWHCQLKMQHSLPWCPNIQIRVAVIAPPSGQGIWWEEPYSKNFRNFVMSVIATKEFLKHVLMDKEATKINHQSSQKGPKNQNKKISGIIFHSNKPIIALQKSLTTMTWWCLLATEWVFQMLPLKRLLLFFTNQILGILIFVHIWYHKF